MHEGTIGTLSDPVGADPGNGRGDPGAGVAGVNGNGKPLWQGYSLDTGLELAASLFRQKYGFPPIETKWAGAVILAGPIGGDGGFLRDFSIKFQGNDSENFRNFDPEPEPVPRSRTARAAVASRAAVEMSAAEAAERARQLALELEVVSK